MASSSTGKVYNHVMEDVIRKLRDEFIKDGGPGEIVLRDLQGIWEKKLIGDILGPIERNSAPLETPNEVVECLSPTYELIFFPTPPQSPIHEAVQTTMPGTAQTPLPETAQTLLTRMIETNDATYVNTATRRPSPYMGGLSRPIEQESVSADQEMAVQGSSSSSEIPQQLDRPILDSPADIYEYQRVANEDYNVVNTPAPDMQTPAPALVPQNDVEDDNDDETLNENDDDDDDGEGEDLTTSNIELKDLVLSLFEKVTRAKNKWKCTLKGGVIEINDTVILFNKATGEFEF